MDPFRKNESKTPGFLSPLSDGDAYRELGSSCEGDLLPAPLTRSIPYSSSLSQPDVYRSLSSGTSLAEGHVYRSIAEPLSTLGIPPPSTLSRKTYTVPSTKLSSFAPLPSQSSDYFSLYRKVEDTPEKVPAEPPTVPGGYLEPSYHFISYSHPLMLLQAVIVILKNNAIDFDVNYPKFKVKCVAFPPGEPKLPFVASVFRMEPDERGKRCAVEFQRRSGDVIYFSNIWAISKQHFREKGLLVKDESISGAKKLPLPKLDVTVTDAQTKETLKCLLQMASSSCCDVKSQAIAALAKMSMEDETQKLMIEEGCLDAFIDSVSSKVEDVHRCAVSALANLAQNHESVCRHIADKGGVHLLCTLTQSGAHQVVRECSRVLGSIATFLGGAIVDEEFRQALEVLRCSRDPFTQKAVEQLFQVLHL